MNLPLIDYARRGLRLDRFPVIDVHAHLCPPDHPSLPGLEARLRVMDQLGIATALLSSTTAVAAEFRLGNDEVAAAVRRYPGRFLGYCHVSANYADQAAAEVERCFATGCFRGIKLYECGPRFDDPRFEAVYALAEEHQAPVLAHTWGGQLTGFDNAAARHPTVVFLAAHAGSGFAYQPYIDAAKRVPNLYLDLTYSREHTNMIETMVRAVGAERVVWGSDEPIFSMAHQLGKLLFAEIPDADKETILWRNAQRLFRLESPT